MSDIACGYFSERSTGRPPFERSSSRRPVVTVISYLEDAGEPYHAAQVAHRSVGSCGHHYYEMIRRLDERPMKITGLATAIADQAKQAGFSGTTSYPGPHQHG